MSAATDFDALAAELRANPDARAVMDENALRRAIGAALAKVREVRGLSFREFAALLGLSLSQTQRLLHIEKGGSVTLRTLCRAADACGLRVVVGFKPRDGAA
jgi:DNA-binding phage protein